MPKKVFELAKELDIGPLDLVESLKAKGFAVRNHMAELSDADVTSYLASVKKDEEASSDTASKKKVVRKKAPAAAAKTVEKKTVERKAAAPAEEADEEKKTTKKASTVKKKATVIRRKTDENTDEESDTMYADSDESEETQVHAATEVEADEEENFVAQPAEDESVTEPTPAVSEEVAASAPASTGGLRVVSKAPVKKETPNEAGVITRKAADKEAIKEAIKEEKKLSTIDRPHRFTPVYTPSKDPMFKENQAKEEAARVAKAEALKAAQPKQFTGTPAEQEDERKRGEEEENKKRMGGLASMMTGKKAIASKAQAITMSRAEEELKSYTALSGTGRPIYTQILRKKDYVGPTQQTERTEVKDSKRVVHIHKGVVLGDLAHKLSVKFKDLLDECLKLNLLIKETDYVGPKLAADICALFNYRVEDKAFNEEKIIGKAAVSEDEKSKFPVRPPVVAIMGHVDHGKTTLLDTIRKDKVASGEAGGITQHIGAYSVKVEGDKTITFLDTPGHAAFGAMRQRGAHATDIVVLVVAADDGVMPQTKESIRFCENAGVPIIIAVNKMDKPGVNPDKVKQELTEFNLLPEDWGGTTQYVHVSALKSMGIDELLEAILLQAEILDLRADEKGPVEGVVIESKIEQGRGPMATILVQSGTLNKGDYLVVGETYGRARSLNDHLGVQLVSAGPSTPVQILGLEDAPAPGDRINIVKSEREAKKIAENRLNERKLLQAAPEKKKVSLEDFFSNAAKEGEEQKLLNLIIRSDVQGSYEAIKSAVESLGNSEVAVKVVAGGVGPITDSDVQMAATANGFLIGFNMRPVTSARKLAEDKGVDIKNYSIIYELINDVKLALEGLLDPEFVEEFIGRAEVREVFNIPKAGVIAGSYVIDGKIAQGCGIRLLRNGKIMHDGKLSSLKRFKDDVKEVKNGYECGISLEGFTNINAGDIFEAYLMVQKKRTLDDAAGMSQSGSKETRANL
ncbi:translation initiation factor IF-2 [Bacteriovorax sp. PP10]|uniref:Translation initiation factor IF-2 n=1 Tax=Bacteriovorax antarcticus TaxID=3088717 RepID=A0ABU5W033_9BACT|nr:translation initiation factor IF-2 [Bacteriovorax sp. PP10]MEA9358572.1 translation initiation factor IF-2 [Bacteriovorax sp. PP10]